MTPRSAVLLLLPCLLGPATPSPADPPSSPSSRHVVCTLEAPLTPELVIAAERYKKRYKMPPMPSGHQKLNPRPGETLAFHSVSCGFDRRVRESLTEMLRRHACKASAVVSGVVKASRFYLTPDRDGVFGEYDVEIDEVFRSAAGQSLKTGATLTMLRGGGAVCTENGGRMEASSNLEPLPAMGGRYLLFLEWDGKAQRYYSSEPARTRVAFKLDDSAQIERLAERPDDVDDGVTPEVLLAEVRFVSGGCAQ